ncbi:MAG: c-type cytochrome [Sandaracinaceae bacterium]|nr:c-type cytochrome [Sandaracinaceae bacterium]
MTTRRPSLAALTAAASFALATSCGFNANDPYLDLPIVTLADAPPPIAGGTLLATRDGRYAVAADPDRHRVVVIELATRAVREIAVDARAEPGRLVEDGAGRVYVALRAGGAILAIDPASAAVTARHEVCASPRGLAWRGGADRVYVACADGTLVTLDAARAVAQTVTLAPDLRDVITTPDGLLVSRFRAAELLHVREDGTVDTTSALPVAALESRSSSTVLTQRYTPNVAVRLTPAGDGGLVLHQRARVGTEAVFRESSAPPPDRYTYSNRPVSNGVVTWRDPCDNAVVHAAATLVGRDGRARHTAPAVPRGVVPIDAAVSPSGRVLLAFAGEPESGYARGPQVVSTSMGLAVAPDAGGCLEGDADRRYPGQVVAVAFAGEVELVQLREPARLVVDGAVVELGGASVRDTGHDIFHLDTGGAIACASCHPGGGDDGHVWHFAATRAIRTQPLEGVVGLTPYHRSGNLPTFFALMRDLEDQMASPPLNEQHIVAAERWLARLPAAPSGPVRDADAVARGRAAFDEAGCASCHQGELGTDGASHMIGGAPWQTPPLRGVALRAPYLHDGRAPTLGDSLTMVSGHDFAHLGDAALGDLVAYLESR